MSTAGLSRGLVLGLALLGVGPAMGLEVAKAPEEGVAPESSVRFDWGFEVKTHFRSSEEAMAGTPFPHGDGPPIVLRTVDPGETFEVSTVSLLGDAHWGDRLRGHLKIDLIDLYERNPTSTDREVDVDEAWLRWGRGITPGELPEGRGWYLKVGKFGHFERQNDRQLESYGLSSTTFNRFEDLGVEAGFDLHRNVYLKASLTQGNPIFFRDPNALAGDTGATLLDPENARLEGGLGLIYDSEVEDVGQGDHLEVGAGLGFRVGDAAGQRSLDLLVWAYQRDLAESVDLEGAELRGDLALLGEIAGGQSLPIRGDEKREWGLNVWYYDGPLAFFGQFVDQDLAGLPRLAYEAELSWSFELPLRWSAAEQQLFSFVTPVVRYSKLQVDFEHPAVTPLPSRAWDWRKLDVGLRLHILEQVDLTAEYAFNHGYLTDVNELLLTLRWRR